MKRLFLQCYACDPRYGSERGLGARNTLEIVKHFDEVFLITEKASEQGLSNFFPEHVNIHYIDIGEKYRNYCWNQGDWRFYIGYRIWLKKSYSFIKSELTENDIAWHISMIGFREPGYLYKLDCPTFIGPVSSTRSLPYSGYKYLSLKNKFGWSIKSVINRLQLRSQRISKAYSAYSGVFCVTKFDQERIKKWNSNIFLVPDTGSSCRKEYKKENSRKYSFLFVGKVVERKGLQIALQAFEMLHDHIYYEIIVVGDGPYLNFLKERFGHLNVEFKGNIDYDLVFQYYKMADYFLHPSLQDAMTSVFTEAISFRLPVLTFNMNGPGETLSSFGISTASITGSLSENYRRLILEYILLTNSEYQVLCEKVGEIACQLTWSNNMRNAINKIEEWSKY